ncbi:Uncharacterized protein, contains ferredoxin domain [Desulfocicer vacuolatum DSM 3385]|uniref:Uncharacterized protein, contains ferredoxin domain n=1 Tax=Desulfocicer vacuolatum DSM 3385 TaxID=1121400 RepID=A0A1W2EL48_9BACT|nr:DUF2148 domain-containing protein [Desulfocicer vacuolatum]SMD09868.1 Uncharacterized protein, contains ferredoxin domain [Desulfocicer vacuolatum DSM 3385]
MGHLIGNDYLQEHLVTVAKNIVLAIKKAPMITGRTPIEAEIIWGEDIVPIIDVIEPVAKAARYVQWDYQTLKGCYDKGEPPVIIGIGAKVDRSDLGWNCGACGFSTCREFNKYAKENSGGGQLGGPCCNWKLLDFGIACDWACASAWQYKVDNRIMGSVGFSLMALNYLPNSNVKLGLALGPARDMVYYSREEMHKKFTYEEEKTDMLKSVPTMFTCFPGNGNPMYKTKDDWWAPPEFMDVKYSEASMDAYQKIVYEQVPEAVMKHVDKISARYKKEK